ncbi:MAG: ImmA/IrrE family metallo-endopeptidase [Magnetococcales bacterium]|nr:ImmA/IrrE family metallo-endopeptidase [Magnetococcales bacterium]
MTPQRRREIHQLAEEILQRFADCMANDVVNVEAMIAKLGGTITRLATNPFAYEAVIQKHDDSFRIDLRPGYPEVRQRFSLAHELGHLFLHMGFEQPEWGKLAEGTDSSMARYGTSDLEYEANEFAAALLV